jgi:hypothetical protein
VPSFSSPDLTFIKSGTKRTWAFNVGLECGESQRDSKATHLDAGQNMVGMIIIGGQTLLRLVDKQ